ncbi:MAG TPA: hypothetical protein VM900_04155 [Sphingomonas sp.]|jgi:hypothetical protein|nr:hypothetical protein [Sphingomonas sp.]
MPIVGLVRIGYDHHLGGGVAMRERRMVLAVAGAAMLLLAARHPTADIQLLTHDVSDPAPRRLQAAVDLGLVGVSVLYTWTVKRLS